MQMGMPIKALWMDWGGEYLSEEFQQHLKAASMEHQLTVHDTPAQNGIAECLNQMLIEKVHTMLHVSSLLMMLWGEAVRHVVWLKNHTLTRALEGVMPLQATMSK